jgi:hypothetical protein
MNYRPSLVFLCILACGPGKGGASETEAATEPATETAATEPATGTGEPTSGTGVPTTGADSCDMFLPPDPADLGPPVAITVKNEGTQVVWVATSGCGGIPSIEIEGQGMKTVTPILSDCSPTRCSEFLELSDCSLGCNDCGGSQSARVEPGGSYVVNWPALFPVPSQVPVECAPGTGCQRECLIDQVAPAGAYTLRLEVFRACEGVCDCDLPPDVTWCPLYDVFTTSEPFTATAQLMYPDASAVDLVIVDP